MEKFVVSLLEKLLMLTLTTMVVLVFGNVVLRYGFNSGITFSEEVSRFAFVWTIFIGALLATRDRTHLGVTGLVNALPLPLKRAAKLISDLIVLMCAGFLLYGTFTLSLDNITNYSPVSQIPLGVVYLSGVLCCLGVCLITLESLYLQFTGRMPADELFVTHEDAIE